MLDRGEIVVKGKWRRQEKWRIKKVAVTILSPLKELVAATGLSPPLIKIVTATY